MINNISGLTEQEVRERVDKGLVNKTEEAAGRSVWDIIKTNTFTFFNGLNLVLAILVIVAGSPKNMLFAGVILSNTLTGIYQELKARNVLKKLSLLNKHPVKVLRDGKKVEIEPEDIVLDDILVLESGNQVFADGTLVSDSILEIDNSTLTGESDPEIRTKGQEILSGSIVFSGYGLLKAEKIGEDTYMAKLSDKAKEFKIVNSELKNSIDKIIKFLVKIIIPLGLMLITSQMVFAEKPWREALLSAIAGIISMIPEGLVLITTLSFFMGVVRLAKWNTLVQELPATEVLARVDTLCLDKTGTITKGSIVLTDIVKAEAETEEIEKELFIMANAFDVANATQAALINYVKKNISELNTGNIKDKTPFNSQRKWSSVEMMNGEKYYLGAPEILFKERFDEISDICMKYADKGSRILLLMKEDTDGEKSASAVLVFEDELRESAQRTIEYFKKQNVDVKIISGDNPLTVARIAQKAGVENAEKYIDAEELPEDKEKLKLLVNDISVFGRVQPEQKKDIVEALQKSGRTVAMTGDGINDVLALKKADCAIALANGSEATKSIAHLVLLDEDFSNLAHVVDEGRRIINNLENNSCLYLSKTVYSILLSLCFALSLSEYPFVPIQLTLIGSLTIGIPSFILALEPNFNKVKSQFLRRVLVRTIPKGASIAFMIFLSYIVMSVLDIRIETIGTFLTLSLGFMGLIVLYLFSRPLTKVKTVMLSISVALFLLAFIIPLGRKIFSFVYIEPVYYGIAAAIAAASYVLMGFAEKTYLKFVIYRENRKKQTKKR